MRLSTHSIAMSEVGAVLDFSFDVPSLPEVGRDVHVEGDVTKLENGYAVRLSARWRSDEACDRCLRPVVLDLGGDAEETVSGDGEALDGTLRTDGTEIDLLPLVTEMAVLNHPVKILCAEDCRGLCDRCGQDLNEGPCECAPQEGDPRFDVLRSLKWEEE